MTPERIRELARQALQEGITLARSFGADKGIEAVEHALRRAVAEERERCARVCEGAMVCTDRPDAHWAKLCAAAIREGE